MGGRPIRAVAALGLVLMGAVLVAVPARAQDAKLVTKTNEWSVYVHEASGNKICFAVAQPKSTKPEGVKRGPVYFYVSSWTEDKVLSEISVKMGYPLKEGVPVEISIGSDKFNLFTKAEGAYVESKDSEQKLVDAIKKGNVMVVQGRSERGTLTTDEYSLLGATAAIDRAAKECS